MANTLIVPGHPLYDELADAWDKNKNLNVFLHGSFEYHTVTRCDDSGDTYPIFIERSVSFSGHYNSSIATTGGSSVGQQGVETRDVKTKRRRRPPTRRKTTEDSESDGDG